MPSTVSFWSCQSAAQDGRQCQLISDVVLLSAGILSLLAAGSDGQSVFRKEIVHRFWLYIQRSPPVAAGILEAVNYRYIPVMGIVVQIFSFTKSVPQQLLGGEKPVAAPVRSIRVFSHSW